MRTNHLRLRTLTTLAVGALLLGGCATKGQLRRGLDAERAALEAERNERISADQRLAGDVGALRTDLEGMRSEFGAQIAALEEGLLFVMPAHFAFDDASVQQDARPALDRFAQVLQRHYPGAVITVEGFADPAGSTAYNRRLSQRRAEAVREYLVARGLPETQIRAVGYGEDRLIVPGAAKDDYGAEMNRRVVFVVETPPQARTPVAAATPVR